MREGAPGCLILLLTITMVYSEEPSDNVEYSLTNSSILDPPKMYARHCKMENANNTCSQYFYDDTSKEFRFNQTNNSTGETTVTIPLHPSNDSNVAYVVTLNLCHSATDNECWRFENMTEKYQTLEFSSIGENCTDETTMYFDVKLSNLWSHKYLLTVKPNNPECTDLGDDGDYDRKYEFDVINNFTKPEPFYKALGMKLTENGYQNEPVVEVQFKNVRPPFRQMELWLQNRSSKKACGPKEDRLVTVYINTEPLDNSSTKGMLQYHSNLGQVSCTWKNKDKLVTCRFVGFGDWPRPQYLMAVVSFASDFRCDFNDGDEQQSNINVSLFNNTRHDCCPYTFFSPRPDQHPDHHKNRVNTEDEPMTAYVILISLLFIIFLVFLTLIIRYCVEQSKSQSYHLSRQNIGDEMILNTELQVFKPKILLMYPLESRIFQSVTTQLRNKLSAFCDKAVIFSLGVAEREKPYALVVDYCDTRHFEAVLANSWKWADIQLRDTSLPVVLVVTSYSLNLINHSQQNQRPSAHSSSDVYSYVFDKIQTPRCCVNRPIFVVRFEESLNTSMVLSERSYLLPKQLAMLVKSLLNNTDVEVIPDSELDNSITDYNRFILNQPDIQT